MQSLRPVSFSPTECFLRYLDLPEDDDANIDLRQAAVIIMSHLDRLATAYLPPPLCQKVFLEVLPSVYFSDFADFFTNEG